MMKTYGGALIKGVLNLHVHSKHKQAFLRFYVTETSDTPLLGREACVQINLVRKVVRKVETWHG